MLRTKDHLLRPLRAANRRKLVLNLEQLEDRLTPASYRTTDGTQIIPLNRSIYDPATGTSTTNPRQQINQITAWIDGSMVYGSDATTAASLRTFTGGLLKTSTGNLPPTDANGNYLAGDIRANE